MTENIPFTVVIFAYAKKLCMPNEHFPSLSGLLEQVGSQLNEQQRLKMSTRSNVTKGVRSSQEDYESWDREQFLFSSVAAGGPWENTAMISAVNKHEFR